MADTAVTKIIRNHAPGQVVKVDHIVEVEVSGILGNDITAPLAIEQVRKFNLQKLPTRDRVMLVMDHFTPNKDIKSAEQVRMVREFAREFQIKHFYDQGRAGIEHVFLPEQGLVKPGQIIVGADSHTCTYGALGAFSCGVGSTDLAFAMMTGKLWLRVPATIKVNFIGELPTWISGKDLILHLISRIGVSGANYRVLEMGGAVVEQLGMADRFAMANMAVEAGAKGGFFQVDDKTRNYLGQAGVKEDFPTIESDLQADYERIIELDVSELTPRVACPHLPENVKGVEELAGVKIDQVVLGSCTNGRIEDLRAAAAVFKQHQVAKNMRFMVIPATPLVYKMALQEGLLEQFILGGAIISPPTCGPCLGGFMGILAKGERSLSTTNRNFVGRMGHKESEIYLANPQVAAATAVTGHITHPAEI